MKILLIKGDDDYAATTFEEEMTVEEAVKKIENGEELSDEYYGKILEFGEVDPKFIEFIRSEIRDYDDSKHLNFYVIQ